MNYFFQEKNPALGPPKDIGFPNLCTLPKEISAFIYPGALNMASDNISLLIQLIIPSFLVYANN